MNKLTAAALAALAFGGCAGETSTENNDSQGHVGSVEAALSLPFGFSIDSINYEVEDSADATVTTGTIDVSDSSRIEFQVGNLPIANGYEMILSATATPTTGTAEPLDCLGRATFDIANNTVTALTMTMVCDGDIVVDVDNRGDIRFTVNVEQGGDRICPVVTGISALPAETAVGSTIQLQGFTSSAADSTAWSGLGGTFSAASALSTGFTCVDGGVFQLTLTASKVDCLDTNYTVQVECTGIPTSETSCTDGNDNDQDGQVDCNDSDCAANAVCLPETACTDGVDNDQDGQADCNDGDCQPLPECQTPTDECRECLNDSCGATYALDLAGPCFNGAPDLVGGPAVPAQPVFSQLCTDAVECSYNHAGNCFLDAIGPARCYCGSQTIDQCNAAGPVADAPCVAEWTAATDCSGIADAATRNSCVLNRQQDLTRPAGYAFFMSGCAVANCAADCTN